MCTVVVAVVCPGPAEQPLGEGLDPEIGLKRGCSLAWVSA